MDLNNNKNFDSKKILEIVNIIKKNYDKDAAIFTLVLCLILFFGTRQFILPAVENLSGNVQKINQKKSELDAFINREKIMVFPQSNQVKRNLAVEIYKAPYEGMDAESASADLVQEIINIIKGTGNNRINQINFATSEVKDNNGNVASGYSILTLTLSIEGNYKAVKNMLNEIYLMKYLVAIRNIKSTPSDNFNIINTDLTLDIYLKLSGLNNTSNENPS